MTAAPPESMRVMVPRLELVSFGHHKGVTRILLLLPTATYRAPDFLAAAAHLGVDVVVGSEHRQALSGSMGDRAVLVSLTDVAAAVDAIVALHRRSPLDAVLAVDDPGVAIASAAAATLGLRHNPPDAIAGARDKTIMRARLGTASLRQPEYRIMPPSSDVVAAAQQIGYPCVVKPVSRSASHGAIRATDPTAPDAPVCRLGA